MCQTRICNFGGRKKLSSITTFGRLLNTKQTRKNHTIHWGEHLGKTDPYLNCRSVRRGALTELKLWARNQKLSTSLTCNEKHFWRNSSSHTVDTSRQSWSSNSINFYNLKNRWHPCLIDLIAANSGQCELGPSGLNYAASKSSAMPIMKRENSPLQNVWAWNYRNSTKFTRHNSADCGIIVKTTRQKSNMKALVVELKISQGTWEFFGTLRKELAVAARKGWSETKTKKVLGFNWYNCLKLVFDSEA